MNSDTIRGIYQKIQLIILLFSLNFRLMYPNGPDLFKLR
jgi:hypothetical protein